VTVRTRFAPAPTGLLHLGHVANAIYVWGLGARLGAGVLLRIEDHDRQRSRAEYESRLLDDLDWLGFTPDLFPTSAFRNGPCASRQSDREVIYDATARDLAARGLAYGCDCPRRDLPGGGPWHCACRDRRLPLVDGLVWRIRLDGGAETFDDVLAGVVAEEPATTFGDTAIRDRLGNWTYQFAVVVDDLSQGIHLVIRGRDLLDSTGLQVRLGRLIGRTTPARFAHHPLVMKTATQKVSKSDGDTGIHELRAAGWSPARVIGAAAHAVGLTPDPRPVSAADVVKLF
jgi:glutamyl-tRNA synthetase/glutamyl-Q tRNA(Asp) synthetase